jgi:hypothetical protein
MPTQTTAPSPKQIQNKRDLDFANVCNEAKPSSKNDNQSTASRGLIARVKSAKPDDSKIGTANDIAIATDQTKPVSRIGSGHRREVSPAATDTIAAVENAKPIDVRFMIETEG